MFLIDTHCHISDGAFAGEEDAYIQRAHEAGVEIMLQPDVDSRERVCIPAPWTKAGRKRLTG